MRAGKKTTWGKVWTGGIIAAFMVSVGIFAVMLQLEKKMLSDYERCSIFVALKEIPKGEVITAENYEEYLTVIEMDKACVPATALYSPEQIEGLSAKERIEEGVPVTTGMFEKFCEITAEMTQPVIAGFKADDLYQVAGGVLRAGDRIHIYTVSESGQAGLVWKNVYVEQVFDSSGSAISRDASVAAQRVNVYLDAADVELFYTELARGTLRVVKVCER